MTSPPYPPPYRSQAGTSHTAVANKTVGPSSKLASPTSPKPATDDGPFAAILVMCDPYEW